MTQTGISSEKNVPAKYQFLREHLSKLKNRFFNEDSSLLFSHFYFRFY